MTQGLQPGTPGDRIAPNFLPDLPGEEGPGLGQRSRRSKKLDLINLLAIINLRQLCLEIR